MPPPDEAPPGLPILPLPRAGGRLPHGLRPIIPPAALPPPRPPPPYSPPPVIPAAPPPESRSRPLTLPSAPDNSSSRIMLIQPPASMLATGLQPLEPAASVPPLVLPLLEKTPPKGLQPVTLPAPATPAGPVTSASPREESTATVKLAPEHESEEAHRRPGLNDDKAAKLGLPAARPANQRRSSHTLKLFGLMLLIMLGCFAGFAALLYDFYQQNIETRLRTGGVPPTIPQSTIPRDEPLPDEKLKAALASASDQVALLKTQMDDLRVRQAAMESRIESSSVQQPREEPAIPSTQLSLTDGLLNRLQSQVTELRTQQGVADAQLKKLEVPAPKVADEKIVGQLADATGRIDRLQAQIEAFAAQQGQTAVQLKKLEEKPAPPPPPTAGEKESKISTVVTVNSEAGLELRLLKERNRITLYADQALANASSEAMASLWRTLRDPDLAFVKDGCVAEIIRVQHFYGSMRGLPPTYRLPVEELFKDGKIHAESDLTDDQVTTLLLDQAQAPEVRTRAAMILTGHKDKKVGTALVQAMRHDPSLLVVKAAQNTLQESYELYAPRLFDAMGMEKAWQEWVAKNDKPEEKK